MYNVLMKTFVSLLPRLGRAHLNWDKFCCFDRVYCD